MQRSQDGKRPHIAIVGAGVAGLSLAYQLTKHAVDVTLVEAGTVAQQGASAVPVALLNPFRGRSARATTLDLAGLEAMWELRSELDTLGINHSLQQSGVLRIASNARQQRKWRQREGLTFLESAPEQYHAPFGAFLASWGGWLQPRRYLTQLAKLIQDRGVKLYEHHPVERLEPGTMVSLLTQDRTFEANTVVLCVGAGSLGGIQLPQLEYVAGDVIAMNLPLQLPYPIAGAVYGMKTTEDFYLGGNHRPAGQSDESAAQQLQGAGGWFIPALKSQPIKHIWTGVRAKQEGHQPLIQALAPNIWFFGALAGRGFLCSAHLSKLLAQELMKG